MSAEAKTTIVALFEGGENIHHYDQITKELKEAGLGNPEGRLYHVAYGIEGGYRVVDVWESRAHLDQFAQRLAPLFIRWAVPQPNVTSILSTTSSRDNTILSYNHIVGMAISLSSCLHFAANRNEIRRVKCGHCYVGR